MSPKEPIVKQSGKKQAIIRRSHGWGDLEMSTMRNGFQSTGFPVDDELLRLMQDAIAEYFKQKEPS